jgi:hypothetical protein
MSYFSYISCPIFFFQVLIRSSLDCLYEELKAKRLETPVGKLSKRRAEQSIEEKALAKLVGCATRIRMDRYIRQPGYIERKKKRRRKL